ncbi:MAG: S-methyl-5'-thioadenosine phosphorylase [Methylocystaceae bacterium]
MTKIAIIGGTGVYDPRILDNVTEHSLNNRYGDVKYMSGSYAGEEIIFLARHGTDHSVPPHLINYRANIWQLKELGVERVIATAAVGSLNIGMKPGSFVITDQFLDFTKGRLATFYDGGEMGVVHSDMTGPYCPQIRQSLLKAGHEQGLVVHDGGVYVCTEGPRFETAAEIIMYQRLGGDLVGMTSVPECTLARELGICYATVCMVTNYGAGISPQRLTHKEVLDAMALATSNLKSLFMTAITSLPPERGCECNGIIADIEELKNA